MLDILAVLSDESGTELREFLAELWDDLGADEILNRCLRAGIRVDVYVKLNSGQLCHTKRPWGRGDVQRTRFLRCHEQPQGL